MLVLTMHEDDAHVFAALRAGARGYLVKGADGDEITRAVLAVAGGDAVYGGSVARRIVDFYAGGGATDSAEQRAFPDLTPRERDVLGAAGRGLPQPRDRSSARDVGEDRPQPCVADPGQAAGARPDRGGAAGPRRGLGG